MPWQFSNYAEAMHWIQGGRNKNDRPIYSSGLRLQRRSGNNLAVFSPWAQEDLVTYHPDGVVTIKCTNPNGYYHPLYSQGIRDVIRRFAGLTAVFQKNHKIHIVPADYTLSPAKVQKCRRCKATGMLSSWCNLPMCWGQQEGCDDREKIFTPGNRYHQHPCEHDMKTGHEVPQSHTCYFCGGTGKQDYGSKRISMLWDGSPLRLINGNPINSKPTDLEKAIAAYVVIQS